MDLASGEGRFRRADGETPSRTGRWSSCTATTRASRRRSTASPRSRTISTPTSCPFCSPGPRADSAVAISTIARARTIRATRSKRCCRRWSTTACAISMLAHSLGNFVAVEALRQMAIRNHGLPAKIKDIMLASPDIDVDVFRRADRGNRERTTSRRRSLCSCRRTIARSAFRKLIAGDEPRLGAVDPAPSPIATYWSARGSMSSISPLSPPTTRRITANSPRAPSCARSASGSPTARSSTTPSRALASARRDRDQRGRRRGQDDGDRDLGAVLRHRQAPNARDRRRQATRPVAGSPGFAPRPGLAINDGHDRSRSPSRHRSCADRRRRRRHRGQSEAPCARARGGCGFGADLMLAPELFLSGYPPEDLGAEARIPGGVSQRMRDPGARDGGRRSRGAGRPALGRGRLALQRRRAVGGRAHRGGAI